MHPLQLIKCCTSKSSDKWQQNSALKPVPKTHEGHTIVRLVVGIVFFMHGTQKVFGWFGGGGFAGTMHFFTDMMHIPAPFALLAIVAEYCGGLGLIFGLLTGSGFPLGFAPQYL